MKLRSAPRLAAIVLPFALAFLTAAAPASAQTIINSVPYTINTSGKYILGQNLNNAGNTICISISAPNVILDLNGFYVAGPGSAASGIPVINVGDVANVTIKNGTIAGSGFGIYFAGYNNGRNQIMQNLVVTRCTVVGIAGYGDAPGSIISNCNLSRIGGGTYSPTAGNAIVTGSGYRIENNTIATVTTNSGGTAVGISMATGSFALGNTISNSGTGISGGKYAHNLTANCTTPYSGGVNAGDNN